MLNPMPYHKKFQHCISQWKVRKSLSSLNVISTAINFLVAIKLFLMFYHQIVRMNFLVNDDYQEFKEIVKNLDQKFHVSISV